jgi:hypothetical protein
VNTKGLWIRDARITSASDMLVLAGFRQPIRASDSGEDPVDWDTSWDRVLVCEKGAWRSEGLPVECHAIRDGFLLSQKGIVVPGWNKKRIAHPRKISVLDIAIRGSEMLGVTGFVARDQVCAIDRDSFHCRAFTKAVPARVRCIRALSDGRLAVAGEGIWISEGDGWTRLREHKGDPICCLAVGRDDEILAGTVGGSVIVQGKLLDPLGRGPILSVVRHRERIYTSTASCVARHEPKGFVALDVPSLPHRLGPTYGKLFVVDDRLWLAGTYAIRWSEDGTHWTEVSM